MNRYGFIKYTRKIEHCFLNHIWLYCNPKVLDAFMFLYWSYFKIQHHVLALEMESLEPSWAQKYVVIARIRQSADGLFTLLVCNLDGKTWEITTYFWTIQSMPEPVWTSMWWKRRLRNPCIVCHTKDCEVQTVTCPH